MDCKPDESLGRQIYALSLDMRNFGEKVLNPFNITMEQLHLLKCLSEETGLSQQAICQIVKKTPANTTRMLDRLEAKLLVVRKDDPNDRRASMVFLTDQGSSMIKVVEGVFETFSQLFLEGISVKEQKTIRNSLKKMADNLKKMSEELKNNA